MLTWVCRQPSTAREVGHESRHLHRHLLSHGSDFSGARPPRNRNRFRRRRRLRLNPNTQWPLERTLLGGFSPLVLTFKLLSMCSNVMVKCMARVFSCTSKCPELFRGTRMDDDEMRGDLSPCAPPGLEVARYAEGWRHYRDIDLM